MKYIKKFEMKYPNGIIKDESLRNYKISNPDDYINKFFVINGKFTEHNVDQLKLNLVTDISVKDGIARYSISIKVRTFIFDTKLRRTNTDVYYYHNNEEVNNIDFMTVDELYKKYPDLCYMLYLDMESDFNKSIPNDKNSYAKWYIELYNMINSIPDFKIYLKSKKYNII